jgi:transcriptional regulator with PAS, ATPase and Fis domain
VRSRKRREPRLRDFFRTRNRAMRALLDTVAKLIDRDAPLLILGESGAGKNHLAAAVHACGARRDQPFVHIDCASIPNDLFESELFGYEKGTFTDAQARKIGRLEVAQGGTVYFDEIAALTPPMQAKLLRAIEEKRFTRLGGHQQIAFTARVISSTNVGLDSLRRDLLYRINVVTVTIPPLRERREDIPLLIGNRPIDDEALRLLLSYSWPGNVRELHNVIERASLLESSDRITAASLPEHLRAAPALVDAATREQWTLNQLEEHYIREILRVAKSNYSRAAQILGINRKTLLEKRKKYGI